MNSRWVVEAIATGGLFRKIKKAPGTVGTLWGVPFVYLFSCLGPLGYMGLTLLFTFFAIFICYAFEEMTREHDLKHVIIDEVVGYLIAMTWLPLTWSSFVMAFVVFRIFDIWKPFPINVLDRRVPGGLGTVIDDVAAGLVTNVILQMVLKSTPWLGSSWV